jgi:acyl-CoA synthetase (AMP-forming)/AMP-acid ligase II/acyl carrier protein
LAGDTALLLHTSGTTARPKLVPFTHRYLCASAGNAGRAQRLAPADRCLNIPPLFHIFGLSSITMSLMNGASLVCPPGFDARLFFQWLDDFSPTWYPAAPAMHMAILAQAPHHTASLDRSSLRIIRSAAAALPVTVLSALERTFHAPVIEGYGLTEASHVCMNPLPPGVRKPGSAGISTGAEIAILNECAPTVLAPQQVGEIGLRGEGVFSGYLNNPQANAEAFTEGWLRTGDLGYLDPDGYLFVTGRLKEIINRGGEKISPHEVEEALLAHPAVSQAAVFAVPDTFLGEDVAAAVVLRQSPARAGKPPASAAELRQFAALSLADFKVPRQILFLEDLPKSPSGKIQRVGMAARLGLIFPPGGSAPGSAFEKPATPLEEALAGIWQEVLHLPLPGRQQKFFEAGGDSFSAARMLARIENDYNIRLSLSDFLTSPTLQGLAELVNKAREAPSPSLSTDSIPVRRKKDA